MGENEKKGGMKTGRILFVKLHLFTKTIPRVIKGMDFIKPKRFLVKSIKSETKTDQKAENDKKNSFSLDKT